MQYPHGGDIYTYKQQFGHRELLDFSSNINPWGIPMPIKKAMCEAINECSNYPDPYCRELIKSLTLKYNLDPSMLFCANGAAEIFFRLADILHPQRTLLIAPTFSEYEAALKLHKCNIFYHTLSAADSFVVHNHILNDLQGIDICVLCNPNNPTGKTIEPALMCKILDHCQRHGIWLVVDECFADFLVDESTHTLLPLLFKYDKLIIVRAFTKMYAIPGVRLGWCASSNTSLIERLFASGQPWGVSVIAQKCGVTAISLPNYAEQVAIKIAQLRGWLITQLANCGMQVFSGSANYVLFFTKRVDLRQALLPYGIMIRDCSNYVGLCPGYFRVAVRTQEENEKLIQKIREVLNG